MLTNTIERVEPRTRCSKHDFPIDLCAVTSITRHVIHQHIPSPFALLQLIRDLERAGFNATLAVDEYVHLTIEAKRSCSDSERDIASSTNRVE